MPQSNLMRTRLIANLLFAPGSVHLLRPKLLRLLLQQDHLLW
jgi:hypothetical protein